MLLFNKFYVDIYINRDIMFRCFNMWKYTRDFGITFFYITLEITDENYRGF
jgi:hypothetical protein